MLVVFTPWSREFHLQRGGGSVKGKMGYREKATDLSACEMTNFLDIHPHVVDKHHRALNKLYWYQALRQGTLLSHYPSPDKFWPLSIRILATLSTRFSLV